MVAAATVTTSTTPLSSNANVIKSLVTTNAMNVVKLVTTKMLTICTGRKIKPHITAATTVCEATNGDQKELLLPHVLTVSSGVATSLQHNLSTHTCSFCFELCCYDVVVVEI